MSITNIPQIVTGDTVTIAVTLLKNGGTFNMTAGTCRAAVVSMDHQTALTASIQQYSHTSGANWGSSLVVVQLSAEVTSAITSYGMAWLEIQVDLSGTTKTWFAQVFVVKGNIS